MRKRIAGTRQSPSGNPCHLSNRFGAMPWAALSEYILLALCAAAYVRCAGNMAFVPFLFIADIYDHGVAAV